MELFMAAKLRRVIQQKVFLFFDENFWELINGKSFLSS